MIRHISDRIQRIGPLCGLVSEKLEYPDPLAVFLEIHDALPGPDMKTEGTHNADIALEITGARLESRLPHYSAFLPDDLVAEYELAPPDRHAMEAVILEARIKDVVYSNPAGMQIAHLTPSPSHSITNLIASLHAFEDSEAARIAALPELDIVGVRLGMSMDEAEKVIREHMHVGRVLSGKRQHDGSMESGILIPATSGKLFISVDERELIAILDEPPAVEGKVLAAWRRVYLPRGAIPATEAALALKEKYGDPDIAGSTPPDRFIWHRSQSDDCRVGHSSGSPLLREIWTDNGQTLDEVVTNSPSMVDGTLPGAYRDPLDPRHALTVSCGPYMSATLMFNGPMAARSTRAADPTREMDQIEQSLIDTEAYLHAFKHSRETIRTRLNNDAPATARPDSGVLKF